MANSIELFCGTGGLALGLQKAGINHKALFEWDKYSCANINYNIENGNSLVSNWKVFETDVREVDFRIYKDVVEIVSGGPPCQPFSFGGKGKAFKDNRDMWPEAIRSVRQILPKAFVFENVKGLLRPAFNDYFHYILLQLKYPLINCIEESWINHYELLMKMEEEGKEVTYDVKYKLINVADYGVPQSRYRVFIIGIRSDLRTNYTFPLPTHSREALLYDKWITGSYWRRHNLKRPNCGISMSRFEQLKKKPPKEKPWRTVRDAIGDLPDPQISELVTISNHEFRAGAKSYKGHSGSALDEPSKTIKAGVHGVPGGENTVILDDGRIRYYTVRESARIQTFDDNYVFVGSWGEAMRQIGNAVPEKMAEIIGISVIEALQRSI